MTVTPLTPAAAPVPTTGAAAGSNPGDFLAQMLDALAQPQPELVEPMPVEPVPIEPMSVEPVETTKPAPVEPVETTKPVPAGPVPVEPVPVEPVPVEPVPVEPVPVEPMPVEPMPVEPMPVEPMPVEPMPVEPVETPKPAAVEPVPVEPVETPTATTTDPALTALVAQYGVQVAATATRLGKVDGATPPTCPPVAPPVDQGRHRGQLDHPGLRLGVDHTEHPVNPQQVAGPPPRTGHEAPPATASTQPTPITTTPATTTPLTATPITTAPITTAPLVGTPPAPTPTSSVPAIADQVFDHVTSLVSRGNGTHRITMKLQPEALGEVRVVLTVREGSVHVRLAAGQEARAALLEGSPELKQLLERTGATETRIEVRQLPAPAVAAVSPAAQTGTQQGHQNLPSDQQAPSAAANQTPANQTPATDTASTGYSGLGGGERSPDRHAGTRADHLATDGDDGSRGHRPGGRRDVAPTRSVGTRAAGVDLTM